MTPLILLAVLWLCCVVFSYGVAIAKLRADLEFFTERSVRLEWQILALFAGFCLMFAPFAAFGAIMSGDFAKHGLKFK